MDIKSPEEFMRAYEKAANSRNFDKVAPLLSDEAIFWFSNGSYTGIESIKLAFEKTWCRIRDEEYSIMHLKWLINGVDCAVCVYEFVSKGTVDGKASEFGGRGTNVLKKTDNEWTIIHEHLSIERQ
jgi:ketosteroid isomerase-like protein